MHNTLIDICDKNFIKCPPDMHIPDLLALIDRERPLPFVVLEENNHPVGLLTSKHLDFAFNYIGCFKNTLCQNFVALSLMRVNAYLGLREAVENLISNNIDGYILTNENEIDIGIVTAKSLFNYFFKLKNSQLNADDHTISLSSNSLSSFLSDVELLEKYEQAKISNNYRGEPIGPMIVCEPIEPIPTSLPYEEIAKELFKAKVINCNSVYEKIYNVKRNEIINTHSVTDRLPDNVVNRELIKHIIQNNFIGHNI